MRANKLETAVHSMPFCSGPPDFFNVHVEWVGAYTYTAVLTSYLHELHENICVYTCTVQVTQYRSHGSYT